MSLRQLASVTGMALESLPQRFGASLVTVIGIAGTVAVFLCILAMASGFAKTMHSTGRADRALVLRAGSGAEIMSALSRDAVLTIANAPGIGHDAGGRALLSAETSSVIKVYEKQGDVEVNAQVRGVGSAGFEVRPEIHIASGRSFRGGTREVMVGVGAQRQYQGLELGSRVLIDKVEWTVVGTFTSGGSATESELLADADTIMSVGHRSQYQSVTLMLESPAAFDELKSALTSNPTLGVDVYRESDYQNGRSQPLHRLLFVLTYVIGGIMALGAIFACMNTMYSAVATRLRELATLRAIGFGSAEVMISVVVEALLLALVGGAVGAAVAGLIFKDSVVSTVLAGTQLIFVPVFEPADILVTIILAVAVGIVGALWPALRATRVPVASALRKR